MTQPAHTPSEKQPHDSVGKHTRTVAGLTLVSRVMGMVRDLITARVFGDTAVGSAFGAAFAIPNMFRRLFGEGALSAAFLPEYTRMSDDDPDKANAFASLTIGILALITGVLTIVIELGLLAVVVFAPEDPERVYSLKLIMVMLPFMPLICVAAILGGMLQTLGRFGPWAAAPILLNLCIIGAAIPFFFVDGADPSQWAYSIGIAAVVAAGLQILWSLWALRGKVQWTRGVGHVKADGMSMLKRMIPVIIGLGTLQLNAFMDTLIAMYPNWVGPTFFGSPYPLDESSNAVLYYAQRLYQFPLGVFGIAVATAAFPALSRVAGEKQRFSDMLARGVRLSLYIGLPASVGLLIVGPGLIRVMYSGFGAGEGTGLDTAGHGFSEDGIIRASAVLMGYAIAVWAYSLNQLFTRAFYAQNDTKTPMRIALVMVGVNLCLNVVLIWKLREAGLAWSTAICAIGQTIGLMIASKRRLGVTLAFDGYQPIIKIIVGSLLMGGLLVGVLMVYPQPMAWAGQLARVAVLTGVGIAAYAVWSIVMKMDELGWLLSRSTSDQR